MRKRKKLKPKGIGSKGVTGKPISLKVALDCLDPILTLAALVVPTRDLFGTAGSVANDKAHIASQVAEFNLRTMRFCFSLVAKTIEAPNRSLGADDLRLAFSSQCSALLLKTLFEAMPLSYSSPRDSKSGRSLVLPSRHRLNS